MEASHYDGLRLWEEYYSADERIIWEMLKAVRFRELAFTFRTNPQGYRKKAFRGRNVIKRRALLHWLKKYLCREEFRHIPCDIFMGIRRLKKGYGPSTRAHIILKNAQYWGYDVVIDIDGEGPTLEDRIEIAWRTAKSIKELLDTLEAPYAIVFSGSRGFHIWLFWEDLKQHFPLEAWPDVFKLSLVPFIAKKAKADIHLIDTSQFAPHGLIRVWYSIHPLSGLACLPLSDHQFENFHLDLAEPRSVRSLPRLGWRGPLKRSKNRSLERLVQEWEKVAPPFALALTRKASQQNSAEQEPQ